MLSFKVFVCRNLIEYLARLRGRDVSSMLPNHALETALEKDVNLSHVLTRSGLLRQKSRADEEVVDDSSLEQSAICERTGN